MLIARDVYTQVETDAIVSNGAPLGQTIIQYEVRAYDDVRNLGDTRSYLVTCTQRLILPNPTPYAPSAGKVSSYNDYPGLLSNTIAVSDPDKHLSSYQVVDYSPRTLNTAVTTNQNVSQGGESTSTQQFASGSSASQTNSFSRSSSVGFFGDSRTGGATVDRSQSSTFEQFCSRSAGGSVSRSNQLSNSDTTSIKDWGCYACIDMNAQSPTWTWGQEYPWNIIQLKGTDGDGNVQLPAYVQDRLYDAADQILLPPSDLAQFGVDFTSTATWVLTPSAPFNGLEPVSFVHTLTYGAATHELTGGVLLASLDTYAPISITSATLDLPVLALDPLSLRDGRPAIVGFLANKFDVAPDSGSKFAITSDTNDLLIRGEGFDGALTTDFTVANPSMTLYFKVLDNVTNLSLALKHWTQNSTAVQLSVSINGNAAVTKFADAPQTSSGGDNVTTIALRNRDFTSVDYCDWLVPGLNTVMISFCAITPGNPTSLYQILAAAIE